MLDVALSCERDHFDEEAGKRVFSIVRVFVHILLMHVRVADTLEID